ncbi:MAG: MFS transporter [Candidatus Lambdaproteobacteria bacterium]|nr:MFS transporter [Candidatus Lambdaproteobacteria bacterium]
MSDPSPPSGEPRLAWLMVFIAAVILGTGFGSMLSVTVFLQPLEAEFGWVRGQTSFAYLVANLMAGTCGIFTGVLVDRISPRPVVAGGAVLMGVSFLLLAQLRSLAGLYVYYGLFLGGLSLSAFLTPLLTLIGFWFQRNRGLAISLTMTGQGVGAAVVPYLSRYMIEHVGWRSAYLLLAVLAWGLLVPLSLLLRDPPGLAAARAASRAAVGPAAGRAPVSPRLLVTLLSVAILGCCVCMAMPLVHVVPLAIGLGIPGQAAASILSVLMISAVVGRVLLGKLSDRIGGLGVLLLSSGLQTVSIFWFTQFPDLSLLYVFAAVFGFGYGGVLPCYPVVVRELIPAHLAGRSVGLVMFSGYIAMGLGGYLGGVLFDLSGDYRLSFGVGALAGAANMALIGAMLLHLHRRGAAELARQPA